MGIKMAKIVNDHCYVSLCNNEKLYYSSEDFSYFNFPSDEPKQKCAPPLVETQVPYLCLPNYISNPKWWLHYKGVLIEQFCSFIY